MQLTLENPDFRFTLRSADGHGALVNEQRLETSFILAPNQLVENWRPRAIGELTPEDMNSVLELSETTR